MARLATCTLLLCAALPAAETTNLRIPGDAIEVVLRVLAIQADGNATALAATHVQVGAYEIRAVADPQNRLRESPRVRTNNQRGIILMVAPPEPPSPQG